MPEFTAQILSRAQSLDSVSSTSMESTLLVLSLQTIITQ
jgi:hypothetical protein